MARAFTQLAFSPSVEAEQARHGVRAFAARIAQRAPANDRLNDDLAAYIAAADSFFIGTASEDGWPHVQHRGGPAGFLKVLDDRTLAFANYIGNRQYITLGNLAENDRVLLFIIDYERGRRLKIWGHAREIDDDPALLERVRDPGYPAAVDSVIRIDIAAWDLNCHQHFPKLVRA
jgi:uncharacterized protein